MYRRAEIDVYGFDSNENNHEVIKEYHFYISDDCTHDTCFVQHCFGMLYKELSRRRLTFKLTLGVVRWLCWSVLIGTIILMVVSPS